MLILHTPTVSNRFRFSEDFLSPYYVKGDPFQSLLARSTYLTKYCRGGEVWTDTIRRVVEANLSLAAEVDSGEAKMLFHLFWTGQALPPGRGLWTGGIEGIPSDARYNCFSGETRFWANGNLTSFEDSVGQTVEVLCQDGKWRPAEVKSFGKQALRTIRMTAPDRSKFSFDFVATPGHRWITSNRGLVEDLKVGDRVLVTPRDVSDLRGTQDFKDGFAHGFMFGDGTKETQKDTTYKIRLCGEKDWQHKDLLKQASQFSYECSPPSYNGDPVLFFKSPTNPRHNLPEDSASSAYQVGFIEGWLAADVSWRTNGVGGNRLNSINATAIDWAIERLPLLGYCPTGRYTDSNEETNYGKRSAPMQVLTVQPKPVEYTVRSITDEGREEEVYCVVEPETKTFTLEGGIVTGNCWYTTLYSIDDWCWTANQLMLGGGVGVGLNEISSLPVVQGHLGARMAVWCADTHQNVSEVQPNPKSFLNGQTPVFRVPDSREGWVAALRTVLTSAFHAKDLIVDVSDVRARGLPIRTFGGIACGPGPLTQLLRSAWSIVRGAAGRKLNSVEALDITNYIGLCIKAGNVRRSALIALGDAEDQAFRDAKKDMEKVISHRHTSNNTIVFRSWRQIHSFNWHALVRDMAENGSGEPGILNLPLGWQKDPGAKGVNPCFSGDTQIAVADGRNSVSIRQLAEEGRDVPVYSVNNSTGKVEIKMGRNPRVTGYRQTLVRVWLDDGGYLDTTPDHKFVLRDGTVLQASELKPGMSLPRFTKRPEKLTSKGKDYYHIYCDTRSERSNRVAEHRLIARFFDPEKWHSVYSTCRKNGFANTGGLVIHHRDYNPLNNAPDNLQIMTFEDHSKAHAKVDQMGEKNGRWSGVPNELVREHAIRLTRQLGRRFSAEDWDQYARDNELPRQFSRYRVQALGTVQGMAKSCALELGYEHTNEDPRIVKTYQSMLKQGYETRICNGKVFVTRVCETCQAQFEVEHSYRERAFCSPTCASKHVNSDMEIHTRRVRGVRNGYRVRMAGVKNSQVRVCSDLRFKLGRDPIRKEWIEACKSQGVSSRIGPTLVFGFKSFQAVREATESYNHKVLRVETLPGEHTVFNITVDDFHTLAVVTSTSLVSSATAYTGIYVMNCGEQLLHDRESCNLAEVFPAKFEDTTNPDLVFRLVTRYCLRQRLTPLSDPKSQEVGLANMRVGVGLGGLCDFSWTKPQLNRWYSMCREEATRYAKELGVNAPITVSTIKPSGTISLLNGSSPGIHAPYAPYYLRRTRIAKNDPMSMAMMEAGVPFEEDIYDKSGHTWVFAFPMKSTSKITVQNETIRDQFQRQKDVQEAWADNAVSATLSFNQDEHEELANCLKEYVPYLKSTSTLPKAHGYAQPPYEAITQSQYEQLYAHIEHSHPLVRGGDMEAEECQNGVCPVR